MEGPAGLDIVTSPAPQGLAPCSRTASGLRRGCLRRVPARLCTRPTVNGRATKWKALRAWISSRPQPRRGLHLVAGRPSASGGAASGGMTRPIRVPRPTVNGRATRWKALRASDIVTTTARLEFVTSPAPQGLAPCSRTAFGLRRGCLRRVRRPIVTPPDRERSGYKMEGPAGLDIVAPPAPQGLAPCSRTAFGLRRGCVRRVPARDCAPARP